MLHRVALCLLLVSSAGCSNGDADPSTAGPTSIELNIINMSRDPSVTFAVFQENLAAPSTPIAWKVFTLASSDHQFLAVDQFFELQVEISRFQLPLEVVRPGQLCKVVQTGSAVQVRISGPSSDPTVLEVENDLVSETIDALIYRGRELLAESEIAPHDLFTFKFPESLHFVAGDYNPGDPITTSQATEISLSGVKSADIVIGGSAATAYTFAINNIVDEHVLSELAGP